MKYALLALMFSICPGVSASSLHDQLHELAQSEGFEIQGLGLLKDEPARVVAGDVRNQIKRLLSGYNYVVVDNDRGDIGKVIILAVGEAVRLPRPEVTSVNIVSTPGEHIIPTRRRGAHQVVDAVLVGPVQAPVAVSLMVDTGASTVVLPRSMISQLGFNADELVDGWTQTANGRVRAKVGILTSVDVGTAVAEDIKVTFLDDHRLGGNKLLGMSFLGHFSLTIDDANSRIILTNE